MHRLRPNFEFVLAYDDYSSLPLSPVIYHKGTIPAHKHFYSNVRKADYKTALLSMDTRNRVLLLVFPPSGPMAREAVQQYISWSRMGNDTVVYVGEGRGGANADESFFSMLEDGPWALLHCLDLPTCVGGKGYEKLFVFQRCSPKQNDADEQERGELKANRVLQYKK